MAKRAILLAESDARQRGVLKYHLQSDGFVVREAIDRASVLAELRRRPPFSLLMMNASLDSKTDGLELARQLRQCHPTPAIILLTTQSSEDLAIAALKAQVDDYFKAPFSYAELTASVRRCLAESASWSPVPLRIGDETLPYVPSSDAMPLIGSSAVMREIQETIAKVAASDCTVPIGGEEPFVPYSNLTC